MVRHGTASWVSTIASFPLQLSANRSIFAGHSAADSVGSVLASEEEVLGRNVNPRASRIEKGVDVQGETRNRIRALVVLSD